METERIVGPVHDVSLQKMEFPRKPNEPCDCENTRFGMAVTQQSFSCTKINALELGMAVTKGIGKKEWGGSRPFDIEAVGSRRREKTGI